MSLPKEKDCESDLKQSEYLGLFECQQMETMRWFRERFTTRQFRTKHVTWDQAMSSYNNYHPAIMCDPCATAPVVGSSDGFMRQSATGITLKSMIAIDCGEIENEFDRVRPGVDCNEIISPEQALRDLLARKALLQSQGFDDIEECLAAEMMITEKIELPKSEYLPDGAAVWFPRNEELNCVENECFGKGQCDTLGILRRWLNKLECYEGSNRVTDVLMHCDTAEDMLKGDDMQECLKNFNARDILGQSMFSRLIQEGQRLITPTGVTLFWQSPEGVRFWKVNLQKKYCTETGEIKKYDLMPKNKLIGFDFSGSSCSYSPVWGYTPITDLKRLLGGGQSVSSAVQSRFTKTNCTFEPAGWQQVVQSNILPFLPYPDSSSCLELCKAENKETLRLNAKKVAADAKKEEA